MTFFDTVSTALQATINAVDDAAWIAKAMAKEFVGRDAAIMSGSQFHQVSTWCGTGSAESCDINLMVDDGLANKDLDYTSVNEKKNNGKENSSNNRSPPTTIASTPTRNSPVYCSDELEEDRPIAKLLSRTLVEDTDIIIQTHTWTDGECSDDISALEEMDDDESTILIGGGGYCATGGSGSDIEFNKPEYHQLLYPSISLPSQLMSVGHFAKRPLLPLHTQKKEVEALPSERLVQHEHGEGLNFNNVFTSENSLSDSWEETMYRVVNVKESRNPPETLCCHVSEKSTTETGPLALTNPWDEHMV
mmetsp:Transcript_192/g.280  ORF Transcript_192/g.280 Transcript_192/m.280 type:complete len:305 (+) Transcript_192:132-1046(+)